MARKASNSRPLCCRGLKYRPSCFIDESIRSVPIPILAVQTLVENAVKHGIAAKQGPGWVCVKAQALRITSRRRRRSFGSRTPERLKLRLTRISFSRARPG
jgi:hypothetical protein